MNRRSQDPPLDNEPFDNAQLPEFTTAENLSAFIRDSEVFSGESEVIVRNLTFLDAKYSKTKARAISRFYSIIALHPSLKSLCDSVPDPEGESEVTRFVLFCRGTKTTAKKRILNVCMMFLAMHLRKKVSSSDDTLNWSDFWLDESLFTIQHANSVYQPNVVALYHRHLFKYFHDQGIVYSLSSDFNFDGGFQAYWTSLFALCKEKRPSDFGERPNKAAFDVDADYKIRNTADPPFTPFALTKKGYDDCMLLMCHYTCVNYCLRGGTEASYSFLFDC